MASLNSSQAQRPFREWVEDALCRKEDPEIWFGNNPGNSKFAQATCAACPVRDLCLQRALAFRSSDTSHGIWAGLNSVQLKRMRNRKGVKR